MPWLPWSFSTMSTAATLTRPMDEVGGVECAPRIHNRAEQHPTRYYIYYVHGISVGVLMNDTCSQHNINSIMYREEVERISSSFLPAAPPSSFWLPQINRTEQQRDDAQQQQQQQPVCSSCNGYYGPSFSQPVCATCHAFLYANDLDAEVNLHAMTMQEDVDGVADADGLGEGGGGDGEGHGHDGDDSDRDSGNEEPMEDVVDPQENNAAQQQEDEGNVEEVGEGGEEDIIPADQGDDMVEDLSGGEHDDESAEIEAALLVVPPVAVAVNQLPPEPIPDDDQDEEENVAEENLVSPPEEEVAAADAIGAARISPQPPWVNLMLPWDLHPAPAGGRRGRGDGGAAAAAATARASFKVDSLSQRLALLSFPRPSDK